jgi:hypothetical protein
MLIYEVVDIARGDGPTDQPTDTPTISMTKSIVSKRGFALNLHFPANTLRFIAARQSLSR